LKFNEWLLVTDKELKRLYRRFKKLDADGSGTLTADEFANIPELAVNPLLERIISIFDANQNGSIEFSGLCSFLFSTNFVN
jgi:Ca2+-binding EF-hand superfamily protein